MSFETFEKVKIELRSILLSSKHGVAASDIQNDYELLSCQRLPYKDLGFNDVQSLIKAMPDVAKEVRLPSGQIMYYAVCDESTAHIQKLVSNQTSKKKKEKYGRGRARGGTFRGRGGFTRGGFLIRREGPSTVTRGGLVGSYRSGVPMATKRGLLVRGALSTRAHAAAGSGDNGSEAYSSSFKSNIAFEDNWDASEVDRETLPLKMSRAIVGRGAAEQHSLSSDTDSDHHRQSMSPNYNLKIGVSQTGQRVISKFGSPLGKNGDVGDGHANEDTSGSRTQFDLRDIINRRRTQQAAAENHGEYNGAVGGKGWNSDTVRPKRVMKENRSTYQKNLPPRLQRKQNQHESFIQERQALLPLPAPVEPPTHFNEENTIYTIDKSNWVPPDDGPQYLQTYYTYFAQREEAAPVIEAIPGKIKKEKGYYGRLVYMDKYYFPLEIMQNEEHALQSAARSFCLTNGIPLLPITEQEQKKPHLNQFSSSMNHNPQQLQHLQNIPESDSTGAQSVVKHLQPQTSDYGQASAPSHRQQCLPETLEKIYKILKPNGVWVSRIENMFQESYGEALNLDFLSVASQWPDYFILEQLAPNRYTAYPVPNALTRETAVKGTHEMKVNEDTHEVKVNEDIHIFVPVPSALQPPVGSKVQMVFSFAYSAADIYLLRADGENLVYEIDEILSQKCPATSPPDVDKITVNSLVAANYLDGWYRAQVVAVEETGVMVYFIDYGNRENVRVSDLRSIPNEQMTQETPSLAIRCALRKSKAGEWCQDVSNILSDLSENHPVFSATILEHTGNQCLVDLYTHEGSLINDMLIESATTSPLQQVTPVKPRAESTEQVKQQPTVVMSPGSAKLFADDPEPLVIPESDTFAVYTCKVMSENTVLLRIVDDDYSDKLDELEQKIADRFYSWPMPKELKRSNIYAGMVLAGAEDAEDVEYDEEGKEKLSDQNKYHRVRMLKDNGDGSCDCYLPDHGHDEVLNCSQLREIDPHLNLSLSYQAVMAKLHGLDKLPDKLKPMAVRLLIKFLTNGTTYCAVKKSRKAEKKKDGLEDVDAVIVYRVRKIISCMRDIQPANVAKIYLDVFGEPVANVEEIIKSIPGFGYWRESLEIDLIDTSQEDGDVNVSEAVLAATELMDKVQSQGGNIDDVWRNLFSSNTSQADTDSGSMQDGPDGWVSKERLDNVLHKLDADGSGVEGEEKLNRVRSYVQDLTKSPAQDDSVESARGKVLYTWNPRPETQNTAAISCHTPTTTLPSTSPLPPTVCDNFSNLPKFWTYQLLKFVSLQIIRVENPSFFVAIPMEQRGALEKLEMAVNQYLSANCQESAKSFSEDVLYAVKSKDVCHRALYLNLVGDVVKVFYPDHYFYDTVHQSELFLLPHQFYSLPFLAHKMRLGGVLPTTGHDWPTDVTQWFKDTISNKGLYALITANECSGTDHRLPDTLVVRLIDTSGSEDLVVEEYMEDQGMAVRDPSSD